MNPETARGEAGNGGGGPTLRPPLTGADRISDAGPSGEGGASAEAAGGPGMDWLRGYRPPAGGRDEMVGASGAIRPAWTGLAATLARLGPDELGRRRLELEEQLRLGGVTYNVYGDSRGADRAWRLDPVPFILESAEWAEVERGLIQRADLLDAVLRDLHGPRHLVRDGLVPAQFLYGHPGFHRACSGGAAPRQRMLHLYSADLARTAGGGFQVVSDRCQNPSGYGYALENRWVLGRVFPSLFRDLGVHRLPPFFQSLRRCLLQAAPPGVPDPFVALLSPGPENETWFEQAYIAGWLGIPLVRGGDLSVREDGVRLESLEGTRKVHVLLRRVDDAYCDPLELDGASLLGVPGLVQAARNRQVTVCNALGSGLIGGSNLMPFLDALSRRLLGQDLMLPSTPTWWLGDRAQREEALARFDQMVIKPLYQGPKRSTWFVGRLPVDQRERLLSRIRARPHLYLAQERGILSTAPCFLDGRMEPRSLVVRSFLCAVDGSYTVMPGGLTRVSSSPGTADVTGQDGGISKDTWILASEPESPSRPPELRLSPLPVNRQQGPMPAGAAENLFWMGRYQERLECQARAWRDILVWLQDLPELGPEGGADWGRLIRLFQPGFPAVSGDLAGLESALIASLESELVVGSPAFNQAALRRAARAVRDLLPDDCWLAVHSLRRPAAAFVAGEGAGAEGSGPGSPPGHARTAGSRGAPAYDLGAVLRHLDTLVLLLGGLTGLENEGIAHGPIRRYLNLGRHLERAQVTARLLGAALGGNLEPSGALLKALLAFHDSATTYRHRYRGEVSTGAICDLLVADELNPRSIAYQLARLCENLGQGSPGESQLLTACEKTALKALTSVRVFETGAGGVRGAGGNEAFEHLMGGVEGWMSQVSDLLSGEFFQAVPLPQAMREWR